MALFSISEYGVDLIISDWNMPNVSGLELFKKVRKEEAFKNTAFILLTVEGGKDKVLEAFKEGVTGYLLNPVLLGDLQKKVHRALKNASAFHRKPRTGL